MLRSILTAVLAVGSLTAPLRAQANASASAEASALVKASVSLTKATDLLFGVHFASDGIVGLTGNAIWTGTTEPGIVLSVSFTLPSALTSQGGGSIPLACGTSSAYVSWSGQGSIPRFNPSLGLPNTGPINSPDGSFNVVLGNGTAPDDPTGCNVDLTGARAGMYTGTIVATVAVVGQAF